MFLNCHENDFDSHEASWLIIDGSNSYTIKTNTF